MPSLRRFKVGSVVVTAAVVLAVAARAAAADWPTYLANNDHTGFAAAETAINAQTASTLGLKWAASAPAPSTVQPAIAGGRIIWGNWDGYVRATDLNGNQLWAAPTGTTTPACHQVPYGIVSSPTVGDVGAGDTVFVGGGDGQFYALNASNGALRWRTRLGPSPESLVWGSPTLYNGSIYIGNSATLDCPLIQAKLFKLNATTGAIQNEFKIVPDGCIGGSLWGSPTVDATTGNVYFASGNDGPCNTSEPYSTAVVAVRASDLSYVSSWKVPAAELVTDSDFGSTPTLFSTIINGTVRQLLGVANKNGVYYVLDRNAISAGPVWQRTVAIGGEDPTSGEGSISPSAWDGRKLYVAGGKTTINGMSCQSGLRALNPVAGTPVWEACLAGYVIGAVSAAPGIVTVGSGSRVLVLDSATGATLFSYSEPSGMPFFGGGSFANGVLYYANYDGNLLALSPPAGDGSPPTAPTNLVAVKHNEGTVIQLKWQASTDNVAVKDYGVYRDGSLLARTTETTYFDQSVVPGTTYTYVVRAFDTSENMSGPSNSITVTAGSDTTPPTAPTNLVAVKHNNGTLIQLKWQASTDNVAVEDYGVYRDGTLIARTTSTTYFDGSVVSGKTYTYVVRAFDTSENVSGPSNAVTVTAGP